MHTIYVNTCRHYATGAHAFKWHHIYSTFRQSENGVDKITFETHGVVWQQIRKHVSDNGRGGVHPLLERNVRDHRQLEATKQLAPLSLLTMLRSDLLEKLSAASVTATLETSSWVGEEINKPLWSWEQTSLFLSGGQGPFLIKYVIFPRDYSVVEHFSIIFIRDRAKHKTDSFSSPPPLFPTHVKGLISPHFSHCWICRLPLCGSAVKYSSCQETNGLPFSDYRLVVVSAIRTEWQLLGDCPHKNALPFIGGAGLWESCLGTALVECLGLQGSFDKSSVNNTNSTVNQTIEARNSDTHGDGFNSSGQDASLTFILTK